MTIFLQILAAAALVVLLVSGGVVTAAWPVEAKRNGQGLILVNRGFGMRNVEVIVSAGDQHRSIHFDRLPSGETVLANDALPAEPNQVTGLSVNGTRLGVSWTHYAALNLDRPSPVRQATGQE